MHIFAIDSAERDSTYEHSIAAFCSPCLVRNAARNFRMNVDKVRLDFHCSPRKLRSIPPRIRVITLLDTIMQATNFTFLKNDTKHLSTIHLPNTESLNFDVPSSCHHDDVAIFGLIVYRSRSNIFLTGSMFYIYYW